MGDVDTPAAHSRAVTTRIGRTAMISRPKEATLSAPHLLRGRSTWALYLIIGLFAYLETSIGPAMPFIRDNLNLGFTAASLHFSAFASGGVLTGMTGERFVRRWGRTVSLWGGMVGMVTGVALLAISPMYAGTLFAAFFTGLTGTVALMANQSALSDLHGARRTVALAESNVAASSAAIMAPLAIGTLDKTGLGWQTALLLGIPVFFLLVLVFGKSEIPPAPIATAKPSERGRLPKLFWIYWAVLFMAASVEWCVAFWGADFIDSVVGLSQSTAATAMSIFFAAMVAGRYAGSRLARTHTGPWLLMRAFALALIGFPIFWLSPLPVVNLIGLFIAGFGIANFYPLSVAAAADAAAHTLDQATARLAIAGGLALLIVPLIVGVISDVVGMRWGFGVVIPLLLGAVVATRHGIRTATQEKIADPEIDDERAITPVPQPTV